MRILAISLGLVVLLCTSAAIYIFVKLYDHSRPPESTAAHVFLSRFKKSPEPEPKGGVTNDVLPSIEQLSGFASAERKILQIGRSRPDTVATHNSFHSADANGSASRAVGSSPGDARGQNTPSSPIDHLTGQFNSALSRAFGSVRLSRPFPVSPCVSESAKSGVSPSKQPHQCPETCDGVDVESQCGSIGQAPSFADESGAATSVHVQDGKSAKSSNSIRSSLADIFRSKHRSPSSKTVQSHSRESVLASVDATTTSPGFPPTPHAEDVNVLFSTSRDSIAIGMPSVPSSLVDSTILLKSDIPHSSMDIPFGLLAKSSPSPPRSDSKRGRNKGDHTESNTLRRSLLFDASSLAILPPASPSSDGVGLISNTSRPNVPTQDTCSRAPYASVLPPPHRSADSKGQPKSRIKAPPPSPSMHSSPSSSMTPSPVLLASLTSESLALAEAIDNLEAEVIYASFPSAPTHSCPQSPSSIRLRQSPIGQSPTKRPLLKPSTSKASPPSSAPSEPEELPASMDIACALHEHLEAFNEKSDDQKSPPISGEVPLIGAGGGFHGLRNGASTTSQVLTPSSSSGKQSGTADIIKEASACISCEVESASASSLSTPRSHFIIPQLVVQSTSNDDTSDPAPGSKSSSRLAISVIPGPDKTTELIELTMQQIRQRVLSYGSSDDGDDDDDELGSFEGDISLICSPGSRRAASVQSGDQDNGYPSDAYDEAPIDAPSHYMVEGEETAYEPEIEHRLHATFRDVDEFAYNTNLAYYNYSRPLVPRPSEVAFRAIMNEGRVVEVGHAPRHLGICKENFVPTVSSPLRASHRAASAYSNSRKSRMSDGSMYSQSQVSEANKMSPSWSSVF